MIRGALRVAPLIGHQSKRGAAAVASPKGVEKIIDSLSKLAKSDATKKAIGAALVELTPPTPAELPRAFKDGIRLFTKRNWKNVTVREAWLNTLVTVEVVCWFFVGEVIGKGTLIGYQV